MAGALSQEVKSPEEIEEGISSIQTVTWDPFRVFPKEIYLEIFNKLENPDDKRNFMNAHEDFYDLFKAKRTRFLFKDVLKKLVIAEAGITRKDLLNYRLVCHDWDEGVQSHFQLNSSNFNLDNLEKGDHRGSLLHALLLDMVLGRRTAESESLSRNPYFSWIGPNGLENALETYSETHPPSKNPFLSRKLGIFPSLVGDYGDGVSQYRAAIDTLLETYGHHIYHCTMVAADLLPRTCLQIAKWLRLMPELKTFYLYFTHLSSPPLTRTNLNEIRDLEFPQPELKNLSVLKTAGLPSQVYNKLFGNVTELEKIQIKLKNQQKSFFKDFKGPNKETLKEAYFTLKNLQDFNSLNRGGSFPNVKKLLIALKFKRGGKAKQPGWQKVFEMLEEKFPALEDLSIRLPTALNLAQAKKAKIQSFEASLNLPKLKKLWVSLPHFSSIDFLLPCKALEEIKIVLENRNKVSREWGGGGEEKIRFLTDLGTLKDSNMWREFPKVRLMEVDDGHEHIYRYHFRKRK